MTFRLEDNYTGGQVKAINRELRERRKIAALQEMYENRMVSSGRLTRRRTEAQRRAEQLAAGAPIRLRRSRRPEKYPGQRTRYLVGAWRPRTQGDQP